MSILSPQITPYKCFAADSKPVLSALPPLSLYIHLPWCVQKCPYCDFNSHPVSPIFDETKYVEALLQDLESELPFVWGRSVTSIFMGGGTPSLFSVTAIETLLSGIRARIQVLPDAEITLEANPGTFEQAKFIGFRQAGINRLSIGVQSFHDHHLQRIGRIHSRHEALIAIDSAVRIFDKVNVDLMYALPEQTITEATADVQTATASGVSHISAYHLTIEPNTAFAQHPPRHLPEEDQALDIEQVVQQHLNEAGFEHYETSAFAKNKQYCQHNLNYWQFGDYIGIGAGAHGKISSPSTIERTVRKKHPKDYLNCLAQKQAHSERHPISQTDLPFEFMMNALRLSAGVPKHLFFERTGLNLSTILPMLEEACRLELMEASAHQLKPTERGKRFLNDLLGLFLT